MFKRNAIPFLVLACLATGIWACRSPRAQRSEVGGSNDIPVSVVFRGCTTRPVVEPIPGLSTPKALFEVTNRSNSRLTCQITIDVYEPGSDHPEFHTGEPIFVDARSAEVVEAYIPEHTDGLRFVVVVSSAGGENGSQPTTNVWRTP